MSSNRMEKMGNRTGLAGLIDRLRYHEAYPRDAPLHDARAIAERRLTLYRPGPASMATREMEFDRSAHGRVPGWRIGTSP